MKAIKRIIASVLAVATVITGLSVGNVQVEAAGKTKTITTTQECSIWTRPNTSEQYRQKKIPAGHQVTVYTDVIPSEKNDGKTFYKTKKGAYILCRCCDGNETSVTPATPTTNVSAFSDPVWAIVQESTKTANMVASSVYTPGAYTETYRGATKDAWGMAQVWMNSIGVLDICKSAKFTKHHDEYVDPYGDGVMIRDYEYYAKVGVYYISVYSGDKGSGITIMDYDYTVSGSQGNSYYFEYWKQQ